jgi:hypothetical protein
MRFLISPFLLLLISMSLSGQEIVDTTVHHVADMQPYPLFKSCNPAIHAGWNVDSVRICGENQLFAILAQNIRYPEEARNNNLQGTVVVSCIIEPASGRMSSLKLLKDIGGGCGAEAIRVLKVLDTLGLRWQAGMLNGKSVRVQHALPIRFKLQEALPYYVTFEGDTIYNTLDKQADFRGGLDSLVSFIINRLDYPANWEDSCRTGVIEMATIIQTNGTLKVMNQLDFNNLGMDFQFEALRLARKSGGLWIPAEYEGKPVNSTMPLRVVFKSDATTCAAINEKFDQAMLLADEGATLLEQEKTEEAIDKWTRALVLQPDNCEILYYRGTAFMNQNKKEEACKDYNRIKEIIGITWFEDIRRLVCGF